MLKRQFDACLIRPGDIPASRDDLEVVGAFNPGAVATGNGNEVALLVRVAERPREQRAGYTPLPRWNVDAGEVVVDWVADDELEVVDPRIMQQKRDGLWRLTFTSHIRVVRSPDGRSIGAIDDTLFVPQEMYEEFGVEDPRITRIGGTFYFTYVAVSRHGAATALASTTDFRTFQRHGLIFCPENKDVVLFPEQINGEYVAIHRPNPSSPFNMPEMWLARSPDLVNWGRHEHFLGGAGSWDTGRIGAGTPPIRTPAGWLAIYHGNQKETDPGVVGAYAAGALLMDLENPAKIIRRSPEPVLTVTAEHERVGFVPNVVFPTGIVERGDSLLVYCGAADSATGVVELSCQELLVTTSGTEPGRYI
ncbi:MAG: glycoside hydrolase family 130 protein [Phycisphaerae bacterium]|nr:glycoside hydrolase family 130 protein [Phycisphaerae bacterium]